MLYYHSVSKHGGIGRGHGKHRGTQRGEREGGREVIDDGGRKKEGSEEKEGRRDGRKY